MTSTSPEKDNVTSQNGTQEPSNPFREPPVRYLGYVGHLGWICKSVFPHQITTVVNVAYVCSDAFVQASDTASRGESDKEIMKTVGDVFLWHLLASFAIPGIFLQGIKSISCQMRSFRSRCRPRSYFFVVPCLLSGLTLPFISKSVDTSVDQFMNKFIRKSAGKDGIIEVSDDDMCDINERNLKFKWFYDQSKDLLALELERYHQKLKHEREREQMLANNIENIPNTSSQSSTSPAGAGADADADADATDGLKTAAVQVDKTTRPPKAKRDRSLE